MDLTHKFTVPASVEDTWTAFNDIESVAGCFPGATVTSVEGDEFKGTCKVKLGPIALVYSGTGAFAQRDESAHRFVVEAKGKDKRGNGTAGATVTAVLTSATLSSTNVEVVTDLAITGKPAQFGRGMIQDVSDKLLQQFATCLESKVGATDDSAIPSDDAASTLSSGSSGGAQTGIEATAGESAGGKHAADSGGQESTGPGPSASANGGAPRSTEQPSRPTAPGTAGGTRETGDDALDLGATVLPILLKSYWKQVAGVVLALLVLKKLLRRNR